MSFESSNGEARGAGDRAAGHPTEEKVVCSPATVLPGAGAEEPQGGDGHTVALL